MAIGATAVWEARADASNSGLQGGFYVTTVGSTDYSQQTAPQLSLADIETDGAGTGITSATGGFTAAMIGNGIYITGGTATDGWYQITAHTDTNTITIDRSAGASKSSVTGRVGGATTVVSTAAAATVAGNKFWIKKGDYTISAAVTFTTSTATALVTVEGYNATRGDKPAVANRPFITCGGYNFTTSGGGVTKYLKLTGTTTTVLYPGIGSYTAYCYVQNTSATANRAAIYLPNAASIYACEAISDSGYGINVAGINALIYNCFVHDCGAYGIYTNSTVCRVINSIVDTCTTAGIYGTNSGDYLNVINCTIYGCGKGIYFLNACDTCNILNNLISNNTTGFEIQQTSSADTLKFYGDYNNYYGNTTDVAYVTKGPNDTAYNPKFTNAASDDFSLASDSECIDAGWSIEAGVG